MITPNTTKTLTTWPLVLSVVFCALFTARIADAANLLNNPAFNVALNPSTDWTAWSYGGGWANQQTDSSADPYDPSGPNSLYMAVGGSSGSSSSGGGVYQITGGAPNVTYTLTADSGVQAWWWPEGEMRLFFMDANNNVLSNPVLVVTTAIDSYDTGLSWSNYTLSATSPAGTTQVKVEFASQSGSGTVWFDNASLTAPINPPVITNLYPDGTLLEQGTNALSFTASSAHVITNIVVTLNGADVSANLIVAGLNSTATSVSYTNLRPNAVYSAHIAVTDNTGSSAVKNISFDTYNPSFSWEAEDYDYDSGQFTNSPVLSSTPAAGSYFGVSGTEGIDFHDYSDDGPETFRPDAMSTAVSGDLPRQNFINAGVPDYIVGYFDGAGFPSGGNTGLGSYNSQEWVNYTRIFPTGVYNVYARIANGNGGTATVPVSRVIAGQGTSTQITSPLGVFSFPAIGWGNYSYVPLTDQFGNKVAVSLSGTNTLRVSAGSGANLNFFILIPADTKTPTITGVYPDGRTLVQGTNKLVFTVSSASHSLPQTNVVVTLNGVTDNILTFTGSASSWNVSTPLALNVTNYTAIITVTDDAGDTSSTTVNFDTFDPASYDIEAEDWDFNGGGHIDNPIITSEADPDSYFDQTGDYGVDEYPGDANSGYAPPTADYHFRANDYIATSLCDDTPTRAVLAAQLTNSLAFNYNVAWWSTNGWLNYTHNYPAGNYHVYARLAGGAGTTNLVELDMVNPSASYLGTFTEAGAGYNTFGWIPLVNTNNGQLATVTLGGVATLRTTSLDGNVNPDSYLLVPAVTAPPALGLNYSAGTLTLSWSDPTFHLEAQTNSTGTGLNGAWSDYPGGGTSPVTITPGQSPGAVFFRLSN